MNRTSTRFWILSCIGSLVLLASGCSTAPVTTGKIPGSKLQDGIYEGFARRFPNSATVHVTIEKGRIVDIDVVKYFASWKGSPAREKIPARILATQSTAVDAVSGATNSSRVIMQAVQRALQRAQGK